MIVRANRKATRPSENIVDISTGRSPRVFLGNTVTIDVGVFNEDGSVRDLSDHTSLTLAFMPAGLSSPAITVKTSPIATPVFTADDLASGISYHARFDLSASDTNPDLAGLLERSFTLVIYGDVGGTEVSHSQGAILITDDGSSVTVDPPDGPDEGITAGEAEALIESMAVLFDRAQTLSSLEQQQSRTNTGDDIAVADDVRAAYQTLIPFASQGEMELGAETSERRMSPLRVAQAIAVLANTIQNDFDHAGAPDGSFDTSQGWSAGSVIIDTSVSPHESYRCSDPTNPAQWIKTSLTSDELATVALSGLYSDITGRPLLIGQAEAEAGASTTERLISAERLFQFLAARKIEDLSDVASGAANGWMLLHDGTRYVPVNGDDIFAIFLPVGTVLPFAGSTEPPGYLICDGRAVSRTVFYEDLFAAIGTTYGAGDGSTTFNLPDLRGRVPAGQDDMGGTPANRLTNQPGGVDGSTLGAGGGEEGHQLTEAEMPEHDHTDFGQFVGREAGASNTGINTSVSSSNDTLTGMTGGDQPHNNVQPTLILNYIIKYK